MVPIRLLSLGLAGLICATLAYLAITQRFSAISQMLNDSEAIKVEVEEKQKPPPPPPPPPNRPPPPPPPDLPPPPPQDVPVVDVPTAPPAPPPPPAVIANPQWIQRPNGADFTREYPDRALEREREGRVVLDCVVASDGRINCSVSQEDPPGWGFGEAAVRIARSFRMSPRTEDGRPTDGGRVRVPITFRLGG